MKNIKFRRSTCGSCEDRKSVKILTRPLHSAGYLSSSADQSVGANGQPLLSCSAGHYLHSSLLALFFYFFFLNHNAHALLRAVICMCRTKVNQVLIHPAALHILHYSVYYPLSFNLITLRLKFSFV